MNIIKRLVRMVAGKYSLYRIYSLDLSNLEPGSHEQGTQEIIDLSLLRNARHEEIRALERYHGKEAVCYAILEKDVPVSACCFWFGETYKQRNFWPLQPRQAKLVQITTAADFRGKGHASRLLSFAAEDMKRRGFEQLFARIWHSNAPSIAAFEKAGWRYVAFVAEIPFLGRTRPWRFVRRRR